MSHYLLIGGSIIIEINMFRTHTSEKQKHKHKKNITNEWNTNTQYTMRYCGYTSPSNNVYSY